MSHCKHLRLAIRTSNKKEKHDISVICLEAATIGSCEITAKLALMAIERDGESLRQEAGVEAMD
jgi:hypothetical protein